MTSGERPFRLLGATTLLETTRRQVVGSVWMAVSKLHTITRSLDITCGRERREEEEGVCKYLYIHLIHSPTQEFRKGPGHTCKNSCYVMYQHSSFGVDESPLSITTDTKFMTCESGRLIPRPFENGNEASILFVHLLLDLVNSSWLPRDHVRHVIVA